MAQDEVDGRHEARALQAVPIEPLRGLVGGRDQGHATREQRLQEVAEQHRIGDVPHVKFVEAQDPHLFGHALGHDIQGALEVSQPLEVAVDGLHEAMEMRAPFVFKGQAFEQGVHQVGLAAADPAPEIQPPERAPTAEPAPQLA